MSGLAGNVGIECQVCDCHFTDCIVVDYTKSIRVTGGANRFTRCHVWGGTVPPKGMGFKEWSDFYARRKKLEGAHKWTAEDERAALAKGVPEMLPGSVAFECIGGANVFDGCFADTAVIGFDVRHGATIINSGAKCEKLYEGRAKDVEWIGNTVGGGANMAADEKNLFGGGK